MTLLRLAGGRLCDPASGLVSSNLGDIYVQDGRIVWSPADQRDRIAKGANGPQVVAAQDLRPPPPKADQTIDCSGCVVMAGGIDLHTHIGGGKVTLARMLMPESMPSDFLPTTRAAGDAYLKMGYSVAVEPAMLACNARQAHAEMADTPHVDTAAYVLLGNDHVLLKLIARGAAQQLIDDYVAFVITATQAIGVKVVNAGGIDAFKFNVRELDVDTPHPHFGVTPGQIIRHLATAVHHLGLPHPLQVHCSNLGVPGNIDSTLATIRAAAGLPIHITHAQFHSYGQGGSKRFSSGAAELAGALAEHPNVTIDVGQIMFGQTVTISGDTMHQYANVRHARPRKSALVDIECEAGCGVVPFRYRHRQFVHSLQWAIGLELFLMVDDPARVLLTTDHPNGGPFTSYPHLIRLLMDRSFRETALAEIDPDAAAASQLAGIGREYTLEEIAVMTRSAPARLLGLADQGTLATGSVADVVVYEEQADRQAMFASPRWVIRRGRVFGRELLQGPPRTIDASEPNDSAAKVTHTVRPNYDRKSLPQLMKIHAESASFSLPNVEISDDELATQIGSDAVVHPCRSRRS
jgi:formylmethanofuran dehydrogenase subunit A